MATNKLWGGRFQAMATPDLDRFGASIEFDQAMAKEDLLGSLAHVKMLKATHILSATDADKLSLGCNACKLN